MEEYFKMVCPPLKKKKVNMGHEVKFPVSYTLMDFNTPAVTQGGRMGKGLTKKIKKYPISSVNQHSKE